jgi:hypothetical protein
MPHGGGMELGFTSYMLLHGYPKRRRGILELRDHPSSRHPRNDKRNKMAISTFDKHKMQQQQKTHPRMTQQKCRK